MNYKITYNKEANTIIVERTNANPEFEYKKGVIQEGLLYVDVRYPMMENPEANHKIEYHIFDCMSEMRDFHAKLIIRPYISDTDTMTLDRLKVTSSLIENVSLKGVLVVPPEILAQAAVYIERAESERSDILRSRLFTHGTYGMFYRTYLIGLAKEQMY